MDTCTKAGVRDKTHTHAVMQSVSAFLALGFYTNVCRQLTLVQLSHALL